MLFSSSFSFYLVAIVVVVVLLVLVFVAVEFSSDFASFALLHHSAHLLLL